MMKDFNIIDPLVVIAICLLKNYTICALHLGTVVGLLMQSRFTGSILFPVDEYL